MPKDIALSPREFARCRSDLSLILFVRLQMMMLKSLRLMSYGSRK